jgi:hypothetical protein
LERAPLVTPRLILLRPDGAPEVLALAAAATAGGGVVDGISLPGLPSGALSIVPTPFGAVLVDVRARGLRLDGRSLPAGARRLLRPGDRLELGSTVLELELPEEATRALASALLADAADAMLLVRPRLVVVEGPDAGARLALRDEAVVGRDSGADLRLHDARASRRHAKFTIRGGAAAVRDLGSKNGLTVNGRSVRGGAAPIAPGDLVAIGDTLLAFEDGLASAALRPPLTPRSSQLAVDVHRAPGAPPTAARIALASAALLAAAGLCIAATF